jgi:hypothetical protein
VTGPATPQRAMYALPLCIGEMQDRGAAEELIVLHSSLIDRLRAEHIDTERPSTLTEMLIERTVTNYVAVKEGEGTGRLRDPRVHKEVNALFLGMVAQLEKAAPRLLDDRARRELVAATLEALNEACENLDAEAARLLRESVAQKFEEKELL